MSHYTKLVRAVMKAHGCEPSLIYTNKLKHTRTVKCYSPSRAAQPSLLSDLSKLMKTLKVKYDIRVNPSNTNFRDSIIVEVPMQDLT